MARRATFGVLNTLLFFPSGAVYPQQAFPDWMRAIATVDPFTYAVHALKALFLRDTGLGAVAGDLVYLAAHRDPSMNVCIPISEDRGLESPVCGHFGSAPAFLVVDTDTRAHRVLVNTNAHHEHGRCAPIALLASEHVAAFVVGGIGPGALANLLAMGVAVYRGALGPVADALDALASGSLPGVTPADTCGHRHG
jgi:predicted Fe-Mo cluster-binding NifX family protein